AGPDGDDWFAVALFTTALCIPPVIAALTARETHKIPTELLGVRTPREKNDRERVAA
nr:MFS transporter [Streptomyces europaeiscabiei]